METGDDSNLSRADRGNQMIQDVILNAVCFTVFLLLNIGLHLAMVVIAALNLNECPVKPKLPPILLAEGSVGIVSKLLGIYFNRLRGITRARFMFLPLGLAIAELALFVIAAVYTFQEFQPNYDPSSGDKYCNKTVFLFSFVYICIVMGLLALTITCVCGIFCIAIAIEVSKQIDEP